MPYAWQCNRCNEVVTPRGDTTPRFCPRCGERLGGAPVEAPDTRLADRGKITGSAIASLAFGVVALFPSVLGVLFGIIAIGLGVTARQRISKSRGTLGGEGLATAGIVLGILGVMLNLAICGRIA